MNASKWMQVAAMTSALGLAGGAFAADNAAMGTDRSGSTGMTPSTETAPLGKTPGSVGANNQTERIPNLDAWMNDYAATHKGQITRDEFMDQMGRRWDMYDTQRQGYLTPEQAHRIYAPGLPSTGSDVTPGYMGPGSVRGK
jgi:hypothetical protein